jgi:hypothetical protein
MEKVFDQKDAGATTGDDPKKWDAYDEYDCKPPKVPFSTEQRVAVATRGQGGHCQAPRRIEDRHASHRTQGRP